MKALDTNILVRFLIQDDKQQTQAVKTLFSQAEEGKQSLFVTLLVVLELIWVLEAVYEVTREDILLSINELLSMPVLNFEKQKVIRQFISDAKTSSFDLSDLLIALSALQEDCEATYTFDKKASKFKFFEKLMVDNS